MEPMKRDWFLEVNCLQQPPARFEATDFEAATTGSTGAYFFAVAPSYLVSLMELRSKCRQHRSADSFQIL